MICPRCTKNTDGVHTCTPTEEWRALEAENAALRAEVTRLRSNDFSTERIQNDCYKLALKVKEEQLAASQAREQQLRVALHKAGMNCVDDFIAVGALQMADSPSDTTALESLIQKAGEVMRERSEKVVEEGTAFIPFQGRGHYQFAANRCRVIRALPAVTLEDVKGGAA